MAPGANQEPKPKLQKVLYSFSSDGIIKRGCFAAQLFPQLNNGPPIERVLEKRHEMLVQNGEIPGNGQVVDLAIAGNVPVHMGVL